MTRKLNIRLDVEPIVYVRGMTEDEVDKEIIKTLNEIAEQIKRHVDNVRYARVVWDNVDYCSHCGYQWETDKDGIPVCCNEAREECSTKK